MKNVGLVLAGGGGKGAYEIGVWKYFHEIGLDQCIGAVSGSSVGALNAALFVGGSYENAEKLWLNISKEKVLAPREIPAEEIMKWIIEKFNLPKSISLSVGKIASTTIGGADKISQNLLKQLRGDYMFSPNGLKQMISEGLDFENLRSSNIPCFATCTCCKDFSAKSFELGKYSEKDITTLLLASAALPIIFPAEEFRGQKYLDGGIRDNIPVKPIYDLGIRNIIVIHLSKETIVEKDRFPGAKMYEIVPQGDLGKAIAGTLDFTKEGVEQRLRLGYTDAKQIMEPVLDAIKLAAEDMNALRQANIRYLKFENNMQTLRDKEKVLEDEKVNEEFDKLLEDI